MGNELGAPQRQNVGIKVGGNLRAQNVLVNQGGQVTFSPPNGDPSPVTAFKTVATACVFFKGRTKILSEIHKILIEMAQMELFHERILVIYGIPGIGKSELMRRFAEVYSSEYPNIGWINAESPETIGQDFQAIADMLKIEWNYNLEPKHNVRKVYEHVAKHCGSNCLFIFDNVTDKKSEIHEFLPADQSITAPPLTVMTANQPMYEYKNLQLDELALSEAMDIFRTSQFLDLNEDKFAHLKKPLTELATLIGCHPLGIVIAASYFCETGTKDLKKTLDYYIKQVRELSERFTEAEPEVPAGTQYKNNLKALWQLTIRRIEKGPHSNAMLSILRLLAYVDPENVTRGELKWLCLTDCPFDDGNHWTAFHEDGRHIFDAALGKLVQLSIIVPITEMGGGNRRYYRVHRLIQRFARLEDEQHLGFIRALYHSVDYGMSSVYPGCLEHLNTIVEKQVSLDEKLKQMCAAFTLKLNRRDKRRFMEYLEKVGDNSSETDTLLLLIQIHDNFRSERHDPASAMEYIWSVIAIAKDWFGPEYGRYMIQHCATEIFRTMLQETCDGLEQIPVPEGYFDDMHSWVKGHIDLHIEQDGQDWRFFPKIISGCMFRVYQILEKVTHPREGLNSMEDFVKCLVYRAYGYCGNDDDLLDGYWHTMAVCLNINGCKRLITDEMIELIVNHATDTVRRATGKNRLVVKCYCGFGDFVVSIRNLSDYISKFLSSNSCVQELSGHTKMLVLRGFSSMHIFWLAIVGVALLHDPNKVLGALLSSWDLPELGRLLSYINEATELATTTTHLPPEVVRHLSNFEEEVRSVLRQLERLESEASGDLQGILIVTLVRKVSPILRKLLDSVND